MNDPEGPNGFAAYVMIAMIVAVPVLIGLSLLILAMRDAT